MSMNSGGYASASGGRVSTGGLSAKRGGRGYRRKLFQRRGDADGGAQGPSM